MKVSKKSLSILTLMLVGVMLCSSLTACGRDAQAIFEQVDYGMSYEQVVEIVGSQGEIAGKLSIVGGLEDRTYNWKIGRQTLVVKFQYNTNTKESSVTNKSLR